jgi:hypothetical protein
MRLSTLLRITLLLWLTAAGAAGAVIFERALPTGPNVNAATPDRSNIKWAPISGATVIGDDFQLPFDAVIDSITVWMIAEDPNTTDPSQELSSIRLYTGTDSDMTLASSAYSFVPVNYDNAQSYWNAARQVYQPIFELTFYNLNWAVFANTLYDFAIEGVGTNHLLSLHASNACDFDPNVGCLSTPGLSVSRQDAPDGAFLEFGSTGPNQLALLFPWYSHPDIHDLWDKASDLNVRIAAVSDIPEPSTLALLGLGLGGLVYFRRRRK